MRGKDGTRASRSRRQTRRIELPRGDFSTTIRAGRRSASSVTWVTTPTIRSSPPRTSTAPMTTWSVSSSSVPKPSSRNRLRQPRPGVGRERRDLLAERQGERQRGQERLAAGQRLHAPSLLAVPRVDDEELVIDHLEPVAAARQLLEVDAAGGRERHQRLLLEERHDPVLAQLEGELLEPGAPFAQRRRPPPRARPAGRSGPRDRSIRRPATAAWPMAAPWAASTDRASAGRSPAPPARDRRLPPAPRRGDPGGRGSLRGHLGTASGDALEPVGDRRRGHRQTDGIVVIDRQRRLGRRDVGGTAPPGPARAGPARAVPAVGSAGADRDPHADRFGPRHEIGDGQRREPGPLGRERAARLAEEPVHRPERLVSGAGRGAPGAVRSATSAWSSAVPSARARRPGRPAAGPRSRRSARPRFRRAASPRRRASPPRGRSGRARAPGVRPPRTPPVRPPDRPPRPPRPRRGRARGSRSPPSSSGAPCRSASVSSGRPQTGHGSPIARPATIAATRSAARAASRASAPARSASTAAASRSVAATAALAAVTAAASTGAIAASERRPASARRAAERGPAGQERPRPFEPPGQHGRIAPGDLGVGDRARGRGGELGVAIGRSPRRRRDRPRPVPAPPTRPAIVAADRARGLSAWRVASVRSRRARRPRDRAPPTGDERRDRLAGRRPAGRRGRRPRRARRGPPRAPRRSRRAYSARGCRPGRSPRPDASAPARRPGPRSARTGPRSSRSARIRRRVFASPARNSANRPWGRRTARVNPA